VKVFLSSDMEGTAGVVDWEQCVGDRPEAAAGRALLLAEVNAAIEGAMAGGATEIVVNDSHYNMRNLPADALAGDASYISGSHKPLYMMQGLEGSFDAVLFVSYHGSVGAPAGLSHTYNPRAVMEARLGGVVTGEAGINALVAAHYGVPVVLVTGDRCACEETAALRSPAGPSRRRWARPRWRSRSAPPTSRRRQAGSAAWSAPAPANYASTARTRSPSTAVFARRSC